MSLFTEILVSDISGVKWAKLQRQMRIAVDNAGIAYTMSGFLTDIQPRDTEGVKFAKLGAWTKLLADNIVPSGGGSGGIITSGVMTGTATTVGAESLFGYFKAPAATTITRAQVSAQEAPVGAAINITLVNQLSASWGEIAVLNDGATSGETIFAPLVLAAGDIVRFKITQVGSGTAGGYITINLL